MATTLRRENQDSPLALATDGVPTEARELVKRWAAMVCRSASGISASDRQWLHDIKRDRVNTRTTERLIELSTTAEFADALWGPMEFRAFVVRTMRPELPSLDDANTHEEDANHFGNLAQMARNARRSSSTNETLRGAMTLQAIASLTLADVAAMDEARSIVVARR